MSVQGTPITQSMAGLGGAERAQAAAKPRRTEREAGPRRVQDELELEVETVVGEGGVRSLKDNTQEEAREDRKSGGQGGRPGKTPGGGGSGIDVNG